jgi:peptidoglycan biosynthesis protein MviN/MurJ (putative lipid II flippase)
MSIVSFANPLIIGLSNVFMPKSVLTWKHDGEPELWHEAIRNTALIAALVAPPTLAALLAGDTVMRFLYQNNEFESLGHTLTVLIAAISAGALGLPAFGERRERSFAAAATAYVPCVLRHYLLGMPTTCWATICQQSLQQKARRSVRA